MNDKTLTLFDRTYAPTRQAVINSLFKPGRTDNGTYPVVSGGYVLYDLTGAPRALITRRCGSIVTAHQSDGRTRYMYALTSSDKDYLNAPDSLTLQHDAARALFEGTQS